MNTIAILDLITFAASFTGLLFIMIRWRQVAAWEIKLLIMSILFLNVLYSVSLFVEWFGNTIFFEPYEDFLGAMIPMMWGFFFYNVIQQASKADLQQNKMQLDMALRGTRAGLWDWEVQEGNLTVNERWADMIGYSVKEMEPLSIETLKKHTHPEDLKKKELLLQKHFNGELAFYECEIRMRHKAGHWIWIMDRGMVVELDYSGKPTRMTGTHIDISGQKLVEHDLKKQMNENQAFNERYMIQNKELRQSLAQIKDINQQLIKAKEKAEESDRLKSAFLSNMSHEIRTPMNGIIGFSSLLTRDELSDEKRIYYANIIINSSNQLLTIVNDILDISRIETGRIDLMEENVDLNELVDDLFTFFKPLSDSKKLSMLTIKDPEINDFTVKTDRVRLRQVLSNLIHNAIKFTEHGGIEFGYKKIKKHIQFYVKDTGIGIARDKHKVIFKPFRQVELEITRVPGGTGLGLAISQKLVELLGGKIWLESQPGVGTVFYFTLPWRPVSQKLNMPEMLAGDYSIGRKNMTILLAEDDEVSYQYFQEVLKQLPVKLIHVNNGIEAVAYCKINRNVHLVLMDIKMPLLNGYSATAQIKAYRPDLPVIAITAFAKEADRVSALKAGCDGYLSKPVKKEVLLSCIKNYAGGKNE